MTEILIIDDSTIWPAEAVEAFGKRGWKVKTVSDGLKGMEALQSQHFDAVVLDRNMPGPSGDEVLRWIRSQTGLENLCVVILTGYAKIDSAVEALKLGAFQYLEKPLRSLDTLRSVLCAGIALHRAHALRKDLLASFDREVIFSTARKTLKDLLDAHGVHALFINKDGTIEAVLGEPPENKARSFPAFARRIRDGAPFVFEQEFAAVEPLEPLISGAGTLMAAPVRGPGGVVGVLDMESRQEHAFDPSWREVLNYLADLIGIALHVNREAEEKLKHRVEAERQKAEVERISGIHREARHSIATPAQIISMQTRELEADLLKPKRSRNQTRIDDRLRFIRDNVEIIEQAIQDMRELSSPQRDLNEEKFDLASLIRDCAKEVLPAKPKTKVIHFAGPDLGKYWAKADKVKLRYCFECLFRNAIEAIETERDQATAPGRKRADSITIAIEHTQTGLLISMSDTGIGFAPDESETLFQPMYSTKIKHPDTGPRSALEGPERVARVLSLMLRSVDRTPIARSLTEARRGSDILIRDGEDSVRMYIGHGVDLDSLGGTDVVVDTGEPLGDEVKERGIGLYSVRRLISQHQGGTITASSHGRHTGAAFTITLPAAT